MKIFHKKRRQIDKSTWLIMKNILAFLVIATFCGLIAKLSSKGNNVVPKDIEEMIKIGIYKDESYRYGNIKRGEVIAMACYIEENVPLVEASIEFIPLDVNPEDAEEVNRFIKNIYEKGYDISKFFEIKSISKNKIEYIASLNADATSDFIKIAFSPDSGVKINAKSVYVSRESFAEMVASAIKAN